MAADSTRRAIARVDSVTRARARADTVSRAIPDSVRLRMRADSTRGLPARMDTLAGIPPDTSGILEIPRTRRVARPATPPPPTPTGFDQPRWVMLRSLVLPGWGQLHNGSWTKALGVAAGEVWLGSQLFDDQRQLGRLSRDIERALQDGDGERYSQLVEAYNARLNDTVRHRWLLGGVMVYALLDAYIDAHFAHFDIEFESEPALPADSGGASERLFVRWRW